MHEIQWVNNEVVYTGGQKICTCTFQRKGLARQKVKKKFNHYRMRGHFSILEQLKMEMFPFTWKTSPKRQWSKQLWKSLFPVNTECHRWEYAWLCVLHEHVVHLCVHVVRGDVLHNYHSFVTGLKMWECINVLSPNFLWVYFPKVKICFGGLLLITKFI